MGVIGSRVTGEKAKRIILVFFFILDVVDCFVLICRLSRTALPISEYSLQSLLDEVTDGTRDRDEKEEENERIQAAVDPNPETQSRS
jgi:hypothetical protein